MSLMSLAGFAAKLGELAIAVHEESKHALERSAEMVEAEAKRSIGTYQDAAAPFAAWPELADSTKADRVRQGFPENEPELRTGEMRASIEHMVEMHGVDGTAYVGSDSEKLEFQELGTSKMPPRSILGGALMRKEDAVRKVIGGYIYGALAGEEVHNKAIDLIE